MGVMPRIGEVWKVWNQKDRKVEVLEVVKVYFFEENSPWVHKGVQIGADSIIHMVNSHWKEGAEARSIDHDKHIPKFEWEKSVELANIRVKFKSMLYT